MDKLAVIDWGIGGLGFYREWKKHRPEDGIIYFSDSGYTPYGKLSTESLANRLSSVFQHLVNIHKVTHIMVACNAASSVLEHCKIPKNTIVEGVISETVNYIEEKLTGKEATIIAGNKIIDSKTYSTLLPQHNLREVAAQPLSALVERGDTYG